MTGQEKLESTYEAILLRHHLDPIININGSRFVGWVGDRHTPTKTLITFTSGEELIVHMTPQQRVELRKKTKVGRLIRSQDRHVASGRLVTNEITDL